MSDRGAMPLAGNPLHRAGNERRDPDWLARRLSAADSRFLPVHRLKMPVTEDDRLAWMPGGAWLERAGEPVLLGLEEGTDNARFAVEIPAAEDEEETGANMEDIPVPAGGFHGLRTIAPRLPAGDAAIAAQARTLIDWHARHRFCAACGAPTRPRNGGGSRACEACAAEHFPRTDPVVIVVVSRGGRALLGRSGRFPGNLYSALAGFMEAGESIEEAVRREVAEEAGIRVGAVRYVASQPWPFPASLMIGCLADGESDDIVTDPEELEDARWFSRDELMDALAGETSLLTVPQPLAIAHHLIRAWLAAD